MKTKNLICGFKNKRNIESKEFIFIKNCPSCGSTLYVEDNQAVSYCKNDIKCKPQVYGRIEHFISKNAMDIEHIGPETIKGLVDNNIISNTADLYKIKFKDILNLEFKLNDDGKIRSLKEKSCNNIIESIEKSKKKPFSNLLFALGKAEEDRKNFEAAMAAYSKGNTIKSKQVPWDSRNFTNECNELIHFFTRDFIKEYEGVGDKNSDPIFVVGLPRSGSTLVEQILSSHSLVEGTTELQNIIALSRKIANKKDSSSKSEYPFALKKLICSESNIG